MRNFKKLIKEHKENPNSAIVVTMDELCNLRSKYDKKYTLHINKLQNVDLKKGIARLNGVPLIHGEWMTHQEHRNTMQW
jgi:hypothetical protein